MEFRVSVTIADLGHSDEAAELCLDSLLALHPETGPVVSQNTANGQLTLTIAVDATDPWAATNLAAKVFTVCLNETGIPKKPVIDLTVTAAAYDDSSENVRELVPA